MSNYLRLDNVKLLMEFQYDDIPQTVVLNFHIYMEAEIELTDRQLELLRDNDLKKSDEPIVVESARFETASVMLGGTSSRDIQKYHNLVKPNFTLEDIAYGITHAILGVDLNVENPSFQTYSDNFSTYRILDIEKIEIIE